MPSKQLKSKVDEYEPINQVKPKSKASQDEDELESYIKPTKQKEKYVPESMLQKKNEFVKTKSEPMNQYKSNKNNSNKNKSKYELDSDSNSEESFYANKRTDSQSEYSDVDYNEYTDTDDVYYEDEEGEEEEEDGEESESDYESYIPSKKQDFRNHFQAKNREDYFQSEKNNRNNEYTRSSSNNRSKEEKEKLRRKVELLELKKAKKYGKSIEEVRAERKQTSIRFNELVNKVLQLEKRVRELETSQVNYTRDNRRR